MNEKDLARARVNHALKNGYSCPNCKNREIGCLIPAMDWNCHDCGHTWKDSVETLEEVLGEYREYGLYKEEVDEFIHSLLMFYEHDDLIRLFINILVRKDIRYAFVEPEEIDWICTMLGNYSKYLEKENPELWDIVSRKRTELMEQYWNK